MFISNNGNVSTFLRLYFSLYIKNKCTLCQLQPIHQVIYYDIFMYLIIVCNWQFQQGQKSTNKVIKNITLEHYNNVGHTS